MGLLDPRRRQVLYNHLLEGLFGSVLAVSVFYAIVFYAINEFIVLVYA